MERQIDATDRQIDALVYQLYGLTDEEIAIVEAATAPPAQTKTRQARQQEERAAAGTAQRFVKRRSLAQTARLGR